MSDPTTEQQLARYNLLCRALQAHPEIDDPLMAVEAPLAELDNLIHRDLLALARQASPDDFAELYLDFERELGRFREFAAYPHLAGKTVVAFGGAFSAGKSSLINALMGEALMVVEVDPTTALPAYVLGGDADAIYALNSHRLRVPLSDEEFASLTHDEKLLYGSEVARALSAAFVVRQDFPWHNLAFIDTPGYSGQTQAVGRTDASIAAAQLGSAHAFIWVVSAKQGTLPESDIDFLAKLDPSIPRLVVVSRADQVNENDLAAITQRIASTLAERNLPVLGVLPASAHPRHKALLAPIVAQLQAWNQSVQPQTFARRFKALFVRYQRGLEAERKALHWQSSRLKRLQMLADDELLGMVEELSAASAEKNQRLEAVAAELAALRGRFFVTLKKVGNQVGITLPEPHEMELLETGRSNLMEQLIALRTEHGGEEPDLRRALRHLCKSGPAKHRHLLLRRMARLSKQDWQVLTVPGEVARYRRLIRRPVVPHSNALLTLTEESQALNRLQLLRRPLTPYAQALTLLCPKKD